jgi:hypothetical protein
VVTYEKILFYYLFGSAQKKSSRVYHCSLFVPIFTEGNHIDEGNLFHFSQQRKMGKMEKLPLGSV